MPFRKPLSFIFLILFLFIAVPVSAHNMPMGGSRWCFGKNSLTAIMEFNPLLFGDIKGVKEAGYNPEALSPEQLPNIAASALQPCVNDKLSLSVNGTTYPLKVTKLTRNENNYFQIWLAAENIGFHNSPNQVKIEYRMLFDETDNQHVNLAFFYLTDAVGADLQKVLDFSQPERQYLFREHCPCLGIYHSGPCGRQSRGRRRRRAGNAKSKG